MKLLRNSLTLREVRGERSLELFACRDATPFVLRLVWYIAPVVALLALVMLHGGDLELKLFLGIGLYAVARALNERYRLTAFVAENHLEIRVRPWWRPTRSVSLAGVTKVRAWWAILILETAESRRWVFIPDSVFFLESDSHSSQRIARFVQEHLAANDEVW